MISMRQLYVAIMDEKIIAGSWFRESSNYPDGEIAIWSSHSSLYEFRKYNPGEALLWEVAMQLKERGFKKFNLTGGDRFKDQFSVTEKIRVCEWVKMSFISEVVLQKETESFDLLDKELYEFLLEEKDQL